MKGFSRRFRWGDFMMNHGDTIGGILIGMGYQDKIYSLLITGSILVVISIFLEYSKD